MGDVDGPSVILCAPRHARAFMLLRCSKATESSSSVTLWHIEAPRATRHRRTDRNVGYSNLVGMRCAGPRGGEGGSNTARRATCNMPHPRNHTPWQPWPPRFPATSPTGCMQAQAFRGARERCSSVMASRRADPPPHPTHPQCGQGMRERDAEPHDVLSALVSSQLMPRRSSSNRSAQ